jgi:hypothetical protein
MKSSGEFDAKKALADLKGEVDYKPSAIVRLRIAMKRLFHSLGIQKKLKRNRIS